MSFLIGCCLVGVFHPVAEEHRLKICLALRMTFDAITIVGLVPTTAYWLSKRRVWKLLKNRKLILGSTGTLLIMLVIVKLQRHLQNLRNVKKL